jgi:CheY-like chemotaxis protein/anti-sigma regulatory factor (Ser/Thr protein kinase)
MSEKLLIVDDDEFIRSVMQELLEQAGYLIETADDGQQAWEKIDAEPGRFDLILLDKHMPRLDGVALLRRIKADSRLKELPVIMLTGDAKQQDIVEGLAEGAFYYLTKPSTEAVLKLVIQNALKDFRQKQELRSLISHKRKSLDILRRAQFCFRSLQEAKYLALWLADASMFPGRTVNGYSELLINAVEHGNLGITYAEKSQLLSEGRWDEEVEARCQLSPYAERQVIVDFEKTATACKVTITDQGDGFDWPAYLEFSPERVFDLHGRGIAMSKAISFDHLEYQGNGNCVVSTVLQRG